MTEAATQPIPAKPTLYLSTRSGLLLSATTSSLWLLLYFALAATFDLALASIFGRAYSAGWRPSGDNPDTPLFKMHNELV